MNVNLQDNDTALAAALGLMLAAALSAGGVYLWRRWQRRRRQLRRIATITAVSFAHARNMLVADGNGGQMYLDWLLLTTRGLLLLDVRDLQGNVFGSQHMADWTVMHGAQRSTFPNPLPPLLDRMAVLARLVPELAVEGRVLFTESAQFPKGIPQRCLRIESLSAEFPVVDSQASATLASAMRPHWERLLGQLTPDTTPLKPI